MENVENIETVSGQADDNREEAELSDDKIVSTEEGIDIRASNIEPTQIVIYEANISLENLRGKVSEWKEARKVLVKTLRELASYLENIGGLTNILVAVRGNVFDRGLAVGGGILTFALGVSLPFLIAGAGIGLASFISRCVGVGGGLIGTCLGVVGGVLTVATGGAALPVVVAGAGLWLGSGVAGWVGAGGGLLARGVTWLGGAVMVVTASTAAVVCVAGAGLWLAIPAITREVLGSGYVQTVNNTIAEHNKITEELGTLLDNIMEEKHQEDTGRSQVTDLKESLLRVVVVIHDGSPCSWVMKDLQGGVRKLAQDWKEGPGQIRMMADQLEEMVDIVNDQLKRLVDIVGEES